MYQRYLADPKSVDPAWHDFFADYRPDGDGHVAHSGHRHDEQQSAARAGTDRPRRAASPEPRAADAKPPPAAPATAKSDGKVETPTKAVTRPRPSRAATPTPAKPPHAKRRRRPHPMRQPRPPRCVAWPPSIVAEHGRLARRSRPRPASGPCPAKLLVDNRIVINNHLARGRGGKVCFTHLIGWAMVRALRDIPR